MSSHPSPESAFTGEAGPDPAPDAPNAADSPDSPDARGGRVATAVRTWQRELVDLGGRNTLLWYRDLPSGTLDLTTAHPGGVAQLMAGRPMRLSGLVRETTAFAEARRRARVIRAKAVELLEERGIETCAMAVGMATWSMPHLRSPRPPAAPVLLRSCVLRPTSPAHQDYDLDLSADIEVNPVLLHYLASEHGIEIDGEELAELAHPARLFDPAPLFHALVERCAELPGFTVADRKVIGTFSYSKLPMVADLTACGDTLADHDVIAALAGDATALADVRRTLGSSPPALPTPATAAAPATAPDPAADGADALTDADADLETESLVLDADSSQQAAIDEVRRGAHLVLDGPPGTGKSQTIANLIAALAADGKRVLFVAEKRAAIEAVTSRLDSVGLGHLVLDAHGGITDRGRTARDIVATLNLHQPAVPGERFRVDAELARRRDQLAGHRHALHDRRSPWGVSVFEAQTRLTTLAHAERPPSTRFRLRGSRIEAIDLDTMESLVADLRTLVDHGALPPAAGAESTQTPTISPTVSAPGSPRSGLIGTASAAEPGRISARPASAAPDPWYAARVTSAADASTALELVTALSSGGLSATTTRLDAVLAAAGLPAAGVPAQWGERLALLTRAQEAHGIFEPEAFTTALTDLLAATGDAAYRRATGAQASLWRRPALRSQARALVRAGVDVPDLHARLRDLAQLRDDWAAAARTGEATAPASLPNVPPDLAEALSAWQRLRADLLWLADRLASTAQGGDLLTTPLPDLAHRLDLLAAAPDRLAVLPVVVPLRDRLAAAGLAPLLEELGARLPAGGAPSDHADQADQADQAADELRFAWWTSVLDTIALDDPRYGGHQGESLRAALADFARLDREHIAGAADGVRAGVRRNLDEIRADHPDQEALVRAEAAKSRRHLALRDLLPRAAAVLTAARPCWAMSPLVVASMLPPGRWFDVVVFDEASQIPPAQAVSAIARARQVVVAGDARQLPPTTFFTTASDEEAGLDESDTALTSGVESILDVLGAVLPTRSLTWHYRSQDERLIAFANAQMYDSRLVTFPGAGQEAPVRLVPVSRSADGEVAATADAGRTAERAETAEVARVVELALDHARRAPAESLGVIALGIRHATRIQEALFAALEAEHDRAVVDFFAADRPGGFFVKNLERVQGDERDAIILTIGFAPGPDGRVKHHFGPLNAEGGERRLNVAITRARRRLTVVSSLTPRDLDPAKLTSRGATMLRDFLLYAEARGELSAAGGAVPGQRDPRDAVVSELAQRLRREGLVVHEGFGTSAPRLDLAIEDPMAPGRLVVAVESDGRRQAEMPTTRDRDRLRPEQLRRLGWRYVRVWSTDLFRDPARDVARIVDEVRRVDVRALDVRAVDVRAVDVRGVDGR